MTSEKPFEDQKTLMRSTLEEKEPRYFIRLPQRMFPGFFPLFWLSWNLINGRQKSKCFAVWCYEFFPVQVINFSRPRASYPNNQNILYISDRTPSQKDLQTGLLTRGPANSRLIFI